MLARSLWAITKGSSIVEGSFLHMGDCQNYGPFLGPYYKAGTGPNLGDPKRDHNFDNPPHLYVLGSQGAASEFCSYQP